MDKKITLDKLISYVMSIHGHKPDDPTPVGVASAPVKHQQNPQDQGLKTVKNRLSASNYIPLTFVNETKTIVDLPKKLKKMFEPFIADTKRHPSLSGKYSLLYSVLYLVLEGVEEMGEEGAEGLVRRFNQRLIDDIKHPDTFDGYGYKKLGWTKKESLAALKGYKNNLMCLRILADYFNVNLVLLNANEDKIYSVYPEPEYNVYKPTLLLGYCDEVFEPIIYNNSKILTHDSLPIRKITHVDKRYMGVLHADFSKDGQKQGPKQFQIGAEDLEQYLDVEEDDEEEESASEDNTFDEVYPGESGDELSEEEYSETEIDREDEEIDGTSKGIFCKKKRKKSTANLTSTEARVSEIDPVKIKKMKLKELQELARIHDLVVRHKPKTKGGRGRLKSKADLIRELLAVK